MSEPGQMHPVDKAFYDLTVAQRNQAWAENARLKAELEQAEKERDSNARAVEHYKDAVDGWKGRLEQAEKERDEYRIEADCAMRDYDTLEAITCETLEAIANPRPNKGFDPWARDSAREALSDIESYKPSDRKSVKDALQAILALPDNKYACVGFHQARSIARAALSVRPSNE
jgi:hypothetical protein